MYSYRAHVYEQYHAAIEQAVELVLCHARMPATGHPDSGATVTERQKFDQRLAATQAAMERLDRAVLGLRAMLPAEIRTAGSLSRHLHWSRRRLREQQPEECMGDARDILVQDLPHLLEAFNAWYEQHSQLDPTLSARLQPLVRAGHINSAVHVSWVVFKTRCVEAFDLSPDLDGWKLTEKLFGDDGVMQDRMSRTERQGYGHLLKGLYTLSRNPNAHNDVAANPAEADAVMILVSRALSRLEEERESSRR